MLIVFLSNHSIKVSTSLNNYSSDQIFIRKFIFLINKEYIHRSFVQILPILGSISGSLLLILDWMEETG